MLPFFSALENKDFSSKEVLYVSFANAASA